MVRPLGHGAGFEARCQKIIDDAAAIFAQRGFATTGIAEISQSVGLRRGAFSYCIESKEYLLVEIQGRVLRPLLRSARRIDELDESPILTLRLLSESLLAMIMRCLDHIWVYEHDYRYLRGENLSRIPNQRREFESIVHNLLRAGMNSGDFREMDSQLSMLQFLNLHNHTYQWVRPDRTWDAEAISRGYCATLIAGFGSHGADIERLETEIGDFRARYDGPTLMAHDDED